MKYLITEEQADTVKKIKVMEKFIDTILSNYDWYEGIDKVSVEDFATSRYNEKTIPLYVFYIITNDDESAYRDASISFGNRGDEIVEEVDNMFESLFPYKHNIPSATWIFRFVRSDNYYDN